MNSMQWKLICEWVRASSVTIIQQYTPFPVIHANLCSLLTHLLSWTAERTSNKNKNNAEEKRGFHLRWLDLNNENCGFGSKCVCWLSGVSYPLNDLFMNALITARGFVIEGGNKMMSAETTDAEQFESQSYFHWKYLRSSVCSCIYNLWPKGCGSIFTK